MNVTVRLALRLILGRLESPSAFLYTDDTMVSKSETKFEYVTKLFDHTTRNVLQLSERTLLYQHHALCPRLELVKDPLPCHPA